MYLYISSRQRNLIGYMSEIWEMGGCGGGVRAGVQDFRDEDIFLHATLGVVQKGKWKRVG